MIKWRGPIYVGRESGAVSIGTNAQALKVLTGTLAASNKLAALASVNVLTSIKPSSEMVAWLGDSDTPYPALADALLVLLVTRRFIEPVFIDVIRSFYEDDLGQLSPRRVDDVNMVALRSAVLKASNENNGNEITAFDALIA